MTTNLQKNVTNDENLNYFLNLIAITLGLHYLCSSTHEL